MNSCCNCENVAAAPRVPNIGKVPRGVWPRVPQPALVRHACSQRCQSWRHKNHMRHQSTVKNINLDLRWMKSSSDIKCQHVDDKKASRRCIKIRNPCASWTKGFLPRPSVALRCTVERKAARLQRQRHMCETPKSTSAKAVFLLISSFWLDFSPCW